jgi:hypothetical protein
MESRRSSRVLEKEKRMEPVAECASTAENSDAEDSQQQMEGLVAALSGTRMDSDEEWAD